MKKYLVTLEFRYSYIEEPEHDIFHRSRTITLGVFDTMGDACENGNKALEILESKFELNPAYNRRERLSKNGGCFGGAKNLVTNLGYLNTPFQFFLKVTTLSFESVETAVAEVMEAGVRYREFKSREDAENV